MPTKKVIPITPVKSWSFSRYHDYKTCPAKFKYKHLDKIKEPGSPALERGAAIHKLAEDYIKGKIRTLPPELKLMAPEFQKLKKLFRKKINGMVVEDNWSFTKDFEHETAWDDWVGCWVRIKLDCAHHLSDTVLMVTDWKTGKFREEMNEDYVEQLELYALTALILHPHIDEVHCRLAYVDQGTVYPPEGGLIFKRDDIPKLKKLWLKRIKPMFSDTIFAPKPNQGCRWCFFSAAKNGPCKF